jgi:hypothetical protein
MKEFFGLAVVVFCVCSANAAVTFEAFETTATRRLFVVSIDKQQTSGWLSIGQEFDGVVLESFDPDSESLTVTRKGTRLVLRLSDSRVLSMESGRAEADNGPIIISSSDGSVVAFEDDLTMDSALRARFAVPPARGEDLYVVLDIPSGAHDMRVARVLDLLKSVGVTRVSFRKTTKPNQSPEPTSGLGPAAAHL